MAGLLLFFFLALLTYIPVFARWFGKTYETITVYIVDIPTLVDGYHADQTRTYLLGKANEEIKAMHGALREIADYLFDNITNIFPKFIIRHLCISLFRQSIFNLFV